MTIVVKGPGLIACSCTDAVVKWEKPGRRLVYFEFSEMFGPRFTDKKGVPLKNQPMPNSMAGQRYWNAFEAWHNETRRPVPPTLPKRS